MAGRSVWVSLARACALTNTQNKKDETGLREAF